MRPRVRSLFRLLFSSPLLLAALAASPATLRAQAVAATTARRTMPDSIRDFGPLVARLSERGGYFNTDNLISNEASYLHVVGAFGRLNVEGGSYIGVGPDQNYSYIAHIKPRAAFLIDIRRDNMLQHLMFKALFARARNRGEYLAYWLGTTVPPATVLRDSTSLQTLVKAIDDAPATEASRRAALNMVRKEVQSFGIPLSAEDLATIQRFHQAFIDEGLSLRFTTTGRAPRDYYPTLRQLLLERDANGRLSSYLVRESDFRLIKSMHRRNLIIPVVGDLGGPHALRAIGTYVRDHGSHVSAMYVSNAEDYLLRGGSFSNYAESVASLPRNRNSVMIRSYFGGPGSHPASIGNYYSTQLLQRMDDFVTRSPSIQYYRDLVTYKYLPLR